MKPDDCHKNLALRHSNKKLALEVTECNKTEVLLNGQKLVLELVAKDAPLPETLAELVRIIEEHAPPGMLGSILLLEEGGHLRHGAAPSLPPEYSSAFDGVAIGPKVGSCGTAAYRGEAVLVEDIATNPLWDEYKAVALQHGLRACWSTPIFDAQRLLLGTFAMYYRHPSLPGPDHQRLIDMATHTAAIAISHHRIEASLRESEELHRLTLGNMSDSIFSTDESGTFKYICPNVDIIFGYSSQEVQAMGNILGLLGQNPFPLSELEALREIRNIERDITDKTGRVRSLLVNVKRISINGGTRLYSCRDITERKLAEEELERESALLFCIIDSASDLIFIKDRDSVYLGCNKASEEFIGLSKNEQIGKTDFDFFDRERAEFIREDDRQVIEGGKTVQDEEWVTYPDGRRVLMDTLKVPFIGPNGKVLGLVGICRDITERKRAEEELRRLNEELERRVQKRTSELAAKNAELERTIQLFMGREVRMAELKNEILKLEQLVRQQGEKNGGLDP